ncbi:unnamed protein product [Ilex paraguariensis]|uniref:PABC domain-containing protein n=1 Tax=Ilex paraguariensis TaxID=185542 RepID=A0ABC8UBU7_9AQUA
MGGFGYRQQLVLGMRPGGGPMPNFFVPMVLQGQQGQRPDGRRGAGPVQQTQQQVPLMQQQSTKLPMPGIAGSMLSVPYDMGGMVPRDAAMGQPMPITALASALANVPVEQQRTMLGENLYPLVDQLEHEHAAKGGFGYRQQLVLGMRPGGGPMPNFFVPMVLQGQQGQRPDGRRGAGPVQQTQQQVPLMQQQSTKLPMPGIAGSMLSVPYDMGGMVPRDAAMGQPMPITALASALANVPVEQQRTMLGENLYPLVDQLEHEHAAKVTGMHLEMDQTEVLHLLESSDALKAKVAEAMEVLRNVHQANSPADQLASLSLLVS